MQVMSDELTHEIPHKQSTMERKNVQDTRIKDIKKNGKLFLASYSHASTRQYCYSGIYSVFKR